jgi:hypothetical protein
MGGKGIESKLKSFYPAGYADGYVVKYSSTTAVAVTSGTINGNGAVYTLAADTTHNMTSLAAGADFHYIYIDDSASAAPTAVIIDSTTEPTWSDSLRGWYNGDNRCIGVVYSPAASATILYFYLLEVSDKLIRVEFPQYPTYFQLASNMNPTSTWQTPDDNESSVFTPVNAVGIRLRLVGADVGALAGVNWVNNESAALHTGLDESPNYQLGYEQVNNVSWGTLGTSRNIKIAGVDTDDNALTAWMSGFEYSR